MKLSRRELLVGRLRRALSGPELPPLRGLRRGLALTEAPPPPERAPDPEESTPPWLIKDRCPS